MKNFLILILLLSLGCSGEKTIADYGYLFKKVMARNEGQLRGNTLGDAMADVRARETIPLSDESDHYLYYNATLDENSYFIISYYFDDDGLYEMNLDIFCGDQETSSTLYTSLLDWFNNHFDEAVENNSLKTWYDEENGRKAEISLTSEAQENGGAYITVSVLNVSS